MSGPFDRVHAHLAEVLGGHGQHFDVLFRDIADGLARVELPLRTESAAIAIANPKVAALCYDRVWSGLSPSIPKEIGFHGATDAEHEFLAYATVLNLHKELAAEDDPTVSRNATKVGAAIEQLLYATLGAPSGHGAINQSARALAHQLGTRYGIAPTTVYTRSALRDAEYRPGDYSVIVTTISGLEVPVERSLEWPQVLELRRDVESRRRFRRFVHWLDKDMVGRSSEFISDEINGRIEDYRATLHKHGVQVALGTLSAVLDSKTLIGGAAAVASLSYASDPIWALLAGGAIVGAKAAVHVCRSLLDLQETRQEVAKDLAFVVELQDLSHTDNTA